jgi:hypothetical protein
MRPELVGAFNEYGIFPFHSGGGSTLDYTANIRKHLPVIFQKFEVKTFLDAPCGSLEWMSSVLEDMPDLNYIGADIAKNIVDYHNETYKNCGNINFIHLDITDDPLPSANMWMVRDCFFHLPHKLVFCALKNFVNSDIEYILTTSHLSDKPNIDIVAGKFELLNLFSAPFNLPEPLYRLTDWISDVNHCFPPREMCVWSKEQITACI